ncbi:MAG: hypothetical protein HFI33_01255 [Lachnospiraceae bacterium]|nr:hypothetical protein [Lachnospiraceae bacterium]
MIDILNIVWGTVTLCFTELFLNSELSFLLYVAMIVLVILTLIRIFRGVKSI